MSSNITRTGAEQLTNEAGDVYIRTHDVVRVFDVAGLSAHRLGFYARAYAEDGRKSARYGTVTIHDVVGIERREPEYDGDPIELVIETKAGSVRIDLFEAEPEGED